jgi:glycosyltransferase involved in cell wall biosynthesis
MTKLVTIGIPVYRRLDFLPHVLNIVRSQDYPDIELIVSDNGMNGSAVHDIVKKYYSRPNRFRQNSSTVAMAIHFNQIIQEASGEYFVLLADDDEISSNYVSELVTLLERHTRASVAMSIHETIDETGVPLRRSSEKVPEMLSGPDFIRAAWGTHEYGYESFSTFVARTANLVKCGGYPDFCRGTASDDALVIKLCLDNFVVFSTRCTYGKRYSGASEGYAMVIQDLSKGLREFLAFVESDPTIGAYAASHPREWRESERYLVNKAWKTYYYRWTGLYRKRLTYLEWVRAAFHMPFIPDYYRAVAQTFTQSVVDDGLEKLEEHLPWAYKIYRTVHPKRLHGGQS